MRKQTLASGLATAILALSTISGITAQGSDKAEEVLAAARKAIGGPALKTFSAEAEVTRNLGQMQMNSEVELLIEMPDKYLRSDAATGGPLNFSTRSGFNGNRPFVSAGSTPGGGQMVIRMGPGGPMPTEKLTPEQQAEVNRMALRSARHDVARLTLGWFGTAHPAVKAQYTYAGEAESADGKADVVDVKGEDGFAARLFIDQTTHLPLMLTYQGPKRMVMTSRPGGERVVTSAGASTGTQRSRPATDEDRKRLADDAQKQIDAMRSAPPTLVEYRIYFGDWSEVDGIKFPLKIQRASDGTPEEEWTITKVKVNPRIDPKKFEVQP